MKIVIIGNGAAGNEAAETIRKYDKTVEITMISDETFPQYSACALPDCISGWIPRSRLFLKNNEDYEDKHIKIEFGQTVTGIDINKNQVILEKTRISYDKLIIAAGSRAFIPPVKGTGLPGNFVVKTLSDVDRINTHKPFRAVVVGSGNIGVEAAEGLEMQGCEVTLIELMDRIMPKAFDEMPSLLLRKILEDNNIKVFTREKVLAAEGVNRVERIITDKQNIPCDTVIWAVGVRQNVELTGGTGIDIGKLGGIKVNSRMQTNHKDVYACGDCIESFDLLTGKPALSMLWPSAKRQAQVAALNCIGKQVEYEGAFNVVMEEIYDTPCVSIGLTADLLGCDFQVIEDKDDHFYYRVLIIDDHVVGLQSIGKCRGVGAVMALIKNKTAVSEVKRVIENGELIQKVPWFLQAGKYLGISEENSCSRKSI